MTPFVHQSLATRYQEVMEVVPLSKILFASDAYHLPELYWLSGRWGKRYLAQALADYVRGGSLDEEEALEAARMILYKIIGRFITCRLKKTAHTKVVFRLIGWWSAVWRLCRGFSCRDKI